MKKIAVMLLVCYAMASAIGAEQKWLPNLGQAVAQAQKENKMVLINFTGSDWCGWCIKFKKEALDTPEFNDYAAKNLVLVEVDFPSRKPQSAGLKAYNKVLDEHYKVSGFPTFVVLSKDGKEIGRQDGYLEGGAKKFISLLDAFKAHSSSAP